MGAREKVGAAYYAARTVTYDWIVLVVYGKRKKNAGKRK